MSDRRPYSRVYWSILSDEEKKFDGIRDRLDRLGAWTLLLVVADMAYPSPAFVPPTVPKRIMSDLVGAGLVEALSGGRYRVTGLKAERERRAAAATRPGPSRTPSGTQEGPERVTSKGLDETETRTSTGSAPDDAADAYWSLTGRYPQGKVLTWIDDLMGRYGSEATTRALVQAHMADSSTTTLLGRTADLLHAEARALDRKEKADEQERLREKRAQPKPLTGPDAEFRAMLEARYAAVRGAA